jgi:dienelactone hydrolase
LLVNGVLTDYAATARPDFAAGVHGYTVDPAKVPANAPPLFIACANDDQDMPATNCSSLYDAWHAKKLSAELHIYSEGGHDFNMRPHGTPSDSWMDRYFDWLGALFRKRDGKSDGSPASQ